MAILFLNNINLSDNELQNAKLHITGTAPTAASGQIYYDSSLNVARYYDNDGWVRLTDTSVTGSTFVSSVLSGTNSEKSYAISLSATGTPGSNTFLRGDNTWAEISGWTLAGDTGTPQLISSGDTASILGTGVISTLVSATDTLTISHSNVTRSDTTSTLSPSFGGTFTVVDSVTSSSQGHITALNLKTVTLPSSDNTDVDVSVANLITRLGQISENVTIGDASDVTVIIPGNLQVIGTVTTNNVETVSTSNGVVFEGSVADNNELTLLAGTLTADRTVTLPDASGTVALTSDLHSAVTLAGSYDYITLSGQQLTLGQIDYATDIANTPTIPVNSDSTYAATISNSVSGLTFNHGLGEDVIVQLYDTVTKETVYADVDRNGNYLNITFASVPTNPIRVLVQKIG